MLRKNKPFSDGLRLGDLLLSAGMLSRDALDSALHLASISRLPLGCVLLSARQITERQLEQVITVQRRARGGSLCVDEAKKVVQKLARGGELVFEKQKIQEDEEVEHSSLLLNLYVRAGILTSSEIPHVIRSSASEQIPCGRLLLLRRRISPSFHRQSIEILVRYRQALISFEDAAAECHRLYRSGAASDNSLVIMGTDRPRRLGHLLLRAGLIDETQLYDALELSLDANRRLGEILVEAGVLFRETVELCVLLLRRIGSGEIAANEAVVYLQQVFAA
jgi:hypothetical protein